MRPDREAEGRAALRRALERRVQLIADHDFRGTDPAGHLAALKAVAHEISDAAARVTMEPRLAHFIERASFEKALEHLKSDP